MHVYIFVSEYMLNFILQIYANPCVLYCTTTATIVMQKTRYNRCKSLVKYRCYFCPRIGFVLSYQIIWGKYFIITYYTELVLFGTAPIKIHAEKFCALLLFGLGRISNC